MRIKNHNYNQKKYANPFFRNKKRKIAKKIKKNLLFNYKIIILFAVLFWLIWFFFFSSFFAVNGIIINGNDKITRKEIENIFYAQLNSRRYLAGRQDNLFLFDKNKFADSVKNRYNFADLKIKIKFPHTLLINIQEKSYAVVWYEADKHYYADASGNIMAVVDPLEINNKKFPLIESRGGNMIYGDIIKEGKDKIEFIINLFNEYNNNKHNFTIDRFIVEPNSDIIKMLVLGGPEIYFSIKEDINKQNIKLLTIINGKLKDDFINKKYIKVNLGDKVYYK